MYGMVQIENQEIQLKEFNQQRVITFKDIDRVHERPESTARQNFNRNKKHFLEGEDYFVCNPYEAQNEFEITAPRGLTLITESGYLMLVKSFTDDLAWKVQRQLVNCYFRIKDQINIEISEKEELSKNEWLKLADYISRASNEGLKVLKVVLNKLAPGEFDNVKTPSTFNLKMKLPDSFSNDLVNALQKNHMTQKELAEKSGYARSSINNYVHGRTNPSDHVVDRISEILNVNFFE